MMGMFIFSIVKYINSPKEEVSKLFSPGIKWGTHHKFDQTTNLKIKSHYCVHTGLVFTFNAFNTRSTLGTAHIGERVRKLEMLLHVRSTSCQNRAENSLSIQNCSASSRTSVHRSSSEHTKRNPRSMERRGRLNCASPPQEGTGDAASGGQLIPSW